MGGHGGGGTQRGGDPVSGYRVPILDSVTLEFLYWFDCMADSERHALEQAEDACGPGETAGPLLVIA